MESKHIQGEFQLPDISWARYENTLKFMFNQQAIFNARFYKQEGLTLEDKERMTKDYALAIYSETTELVDETNWKWWKTQKKDIKVQEIAFEITDLFCFLLSMCHIWGISHEMLLQSYICKMSENVKRQERGY